MSANATQMTGRAQALRQAFDRSFAQPPSPEVARMEEFLAVRVAGDAYALRVREIAGLFVDKVVAPLPSEVPQLLGVSGLRGAIVPVYDLGTLLGYPARTSARWLVLARSLEPVALAFERFERHLRLPREALAPAERPPSAVRETAQTADGALAVIHLPSILEVIKNRARQGVQ